MIKSLDYCSFFKCICVLCFVICSLILDDNILLQNTNMSNSNEVKKRARNVNFCSREEELLIELVTANKHVLENKKTDAVMWKDKEDCWKKLALEFNSLALLVPRTVAQLQLKYKNIKKLVRKKSASIR